MEIGFYILPNLRTEQERLAKACHLVEFLYKEGKQVWVNLANQAVAEGFDSQLWVFRDTSFVPHALYEDMDSSTPVILSWDYKAEPKGNCLVNLAWELPKENFAWHQFDQLIDLVGEADKIMARDRYRFYRTLGTIKDYTSFPRVVT